jgi:hypothetical protein
MAGLIFNACRSMVRRSSSPSRPKLQAYRDRYPMFVNTHCTWDPNSTISFQINGALVMTATVTDLALRAP